MAADISYNWANWEVDVTGTDQDDHITMEESQLLTGFQYNGRYFQPLYSSAVKVSVMDMQGNLKQDAQGNDLQETFVKWQVTRVNVNALGGDDTVDNLTNVRSTQFGGAGVDRLNGGSAADVLSGEGDNDVLHGGDGADILRGGHGDDSLYGERHDDTYMFAGGSYYSLPADQVFTWDIGSDTIWEFANSYTDTLDFSGAEEGISIDLAITGSSRVQQVHDGLRLRLMNSGGIENVIGTEFADTIRGNGRDNQILAGYGNDRLEGRGGNDHLDGSRGRDIYDFGADAGGTDEIFDYYLDGAKNRLDFRNFGQGIDLDIDVQSVQQIASGLSLRLDHADTIKEVVGTDHDDVIFGNYENNSIWGRGGDDTIRGREGHDWLYGQAGDDTLSGDDGDDYLSGGADNDTLRGNAGADTLRGWGGDDTLWGDTEDGTVDGGTGWDYHYRAWYWRWWS